MSKTKRNTIVERSPTEKNFLLSQIEVFQGKRVMVIGDVGVDEYIHGHVDRISPEAPVPVLEVQSEDSRLGMAANVALNISSLGGIPYLISVRGQDQGGQLLEALLKKEAISTEGILIDESRPTTRKTRVMATHHHLCRIDFETKRELSPEVEAQFFKQIKKQIAEVDIVILEDYAKGALSTQLISEIVSLAHQSQKRILVDPHVSHNSEYYKGVDLLKPNLKEALALVKMDTDQYNKLDQPAAQVMKKLQKLTSAKEIVMTMGKDGILIHGEAGLKQVPTFARAVFDVTGAGDTVIAVLSLGLAAGLDLYQSCVLANYAAGFVVGRVGCVPCSSEDLRDYILQSN